MHETEYSMIHSPAVESDFGSTTMNFPNLMNQIMPIDMKKIKKLNKIHSKLHYKYL